MPSSRGCRSSYDCIVKIKGVTTRPILFSQLMRSDGEGAMNPRSCSQTTAAPPPSRSVSTRTSYTRSCAACWTGRYPF